MPHNISQILGDYSVTWLGDTSLYPDIINPEVVNNVQGNNLVVLLPDNTIQEQEHQLAEYFSNGAKWMTPVLAFGEVAHCRADFHSFHFNEVNLSAGLQEISAVQERIEQLPHFVHDGDALALSVLGLAYSRQTEIKASWMADSPQMHRYPLLCGIDDPHQVLDMLVELELVVRLPFERVNQCQFCHSSRLAVREECANCNSSFIDETPLVHHYSCGFLAPEPSFVSGRLLNCPKCRKELRHYGVDYDKPGSHFVCSLCHESSPDPEIGFICTDCGQRTSGENISSIDIFHYQLSNEGIRVLNRGVLPSTTISTVVQNLHAHYSVRKFLALSEHQYKMANRYKRLLGGLTIDISNISALEKTIGTQKLRKSFLLISEVISENLRDTDLLTSKDDQIYIVLPETNPQNMPVLIERIKSEVSKTVNTKVSLSVESFSLDNITQLFNCLD